MKCFPVSSHAQLKCFLQDPQYLEENFSFSEKELPKIKAEQKGKHKSKNLSVVDI